MKSWHIILIGIFAIVIVSMIIKYMAASKLADITTEQLNSSGRTMACSSTNLQTGKTCHGYAAIDKNGYTYCKCTSVE